MADIYLRSTDGNDVDSGSTWALAKATLAAALTAAGTGGRVFVSQAHSEPLAATTTFTIPAGCRVIACSDAAEPPTAIVKASDVTHPVIYANAANYAINISIDDGAVVQGIEFQPYNGGYTGTTAGFTVSNTVNGQGLFVLRYCKVNPGATSTGAYTYSFGTNGRSRKIVIDECEFVTRNASAQLRMMYGKYFLRKVTFSGTMPNAPFVAESYADVFVEDSDLSNLTTALVTNKTDVGGTVTFHRCKLANAVAKSSGSRTHSQTTRVQLVNCDSADTNYRFDDDQYIGEVVTETTLVRTGGATDGTTAVSWKMATGANATEQIPLVSPEMAIWNETTAASKTVTVEILHDSATNLTDAEVWLDLNYLGTSGFPVGATVNDARAHLLATAADQTASTVAWTTTGMTTPNKQKMSVTFTPQEKGFFIGRVYLAKASKTIYVDCEMTVS